MCITGSYIVQGDISGIVIMLIFGVLGTLFNGAGIPCMPLILGVILGPIIEKNLRQALIIEGGDLLNLLLRPSSGIILAISIMSFVFPYIGRLVKCNNCSK